MKQQECINETATKNEMRTLNSVISNQKEESHAQTIHYIAHITSKVYLSAFCNYN